LNKWGTKKKSSREIGMEGKGPKLKKETGKTGTADHLLWGDLHKRGRRQVKVKGGDQGKMEGRDCG